MQANRQNRLRDELRWQLKTGEASLLLDWQQRGHASAYLRGRCRLVDQILRRLWQQLKQQPLETNPLNKAGPVNELSLIAVGGYGRGELYPASDIDLLVLLPETQTSSATLEEIARFIRELWDTGLAVGHSVRTSAECLQAARNDISIATALLEARWLAGNRQAFQKFRQSYREQLDLQVFFKAKYAEQEARHARFDNTAFSLEPNCKESPGGLRDLQVISWLARAAGLGHRWRDLFRQKLITQEEAQQLERVERFLRRLRIRLHLIAGRLEDRLLFDYQETLAHTWGLRASRSRRAAERLMQRYYRNAKLIRQLNTLLLQNLGVRLFAEYTGSPIYINPYFQTVRELLDLRDPQLFEQRPQAIFESILLLQQRSELRGMTARSLRALWRARNQIDADFRRQPRHRQLFLALFQQRRGLEQALRLMNRYDLLGRYLPAFGRIVGQMQHDLFHVYTVDQHILQVISNLCHYAQADAATEEPELYRLLQDFERPWLIYIAALFHDIAKGRGGDHSQLGTLEARHFCLQHGVDDEDRELIEFLVAEHLLMSSVAQKQDLSDPQVIHNFARRVLTLRRLNALYLLTVADIRGTSPKIWNSWKARLLDELYQACRHQLLHLDTPTPGREQRQAAARRLLRRAAADSPQIMAFWQSLDTDYFMRHSAEELAWHAQHLAQTGISQQPKLKARLHAQAEGVQVVVMVPDQALLFARLAGFFSRQGYSIVDARIHTSKDGYALDSFVLLPRLAGTLTRTPPEILEQRLLRELTSCPALSAPAKTRLSRQLRHFPVTPEVSLHPADQPNLLTLAIVAADRPGLLYSIAIVLARQGYSIHSARIATLGERVEDSFLIGRDPLAKMDVTMDSPAGEHTLEQALLDVLKI